MPTEVLMPQMGESIAEGTIAKWLVNVGERVERDQPLLEISTDKVDAEIPSPASGVLIQILHPAGTTVAVNSVVGMIGEAGEQPVAAAAASPAPPATAVTATVPAPAAPAATASVPAPAATAVTASVPAPAAPAAITSVPTPRPTAVPTVAPPSPPVPPPAAIAAATVAVPAGDFDRDLIVIGSGPGGYVAAIRAAQLGLKVALVEKDVRAGGTCTLRGCIPTKALLHTASLLDEIRHAGDFGIASAEPRLDIVKAQAYKSGVVDKNSKGIEFLLKKNKCPVLSGFGRLVGAHEVQVSNGADKTIHRARNILVATGSVPREIGMAPTDGRAILNSDHILEIDRVPKSLVVLGAGAVGTEFASIFASFGSTVTLVEMLPRILPIEDEDVSAELERALKKRGIKVMAGTAMTAVEKTADGVRVQLDKGGRASSVEAEVLLVAIGRKPVTEGLGLEALGIKVERGYVQVNQWMQTAVPNVYAIGDVVPTPWLAHVASSEGILAVEHMAGEGARPLNYDRVPSCTYCEPEVGSVGLTEAKARERGYDVATGKFAFTALGKARIVGKTAGFVKIVRDLKYDEILGVHIIGAHATDLIAEACVALQAEMTTAELVRTMHAHPTLSEAVLEAAHAAAGHAIHS